MANNFFKTQFDRSRNAGLTKRFTDKSTEWFKEQLKGLTFGTKNRSRDKLLKDEGLRTIEDPTTYAPGRMYMYFYEAKHAKTLPYYDQFPLILLVDSAPGGFVGLNLHYLPPLVRAKFFSELLDLKNQKKYTRETRIKLTYDILKSAAKFKYFRPCYKRYLFKQVKSVFREVPSQYWEVACWLPTQKFVGASANTVWAESKKYYI